MHSGSQLVRRRLGDRPNDTQSPFRGASPTATDRATPCVAVRRFVLTKAQFYGRRPVYICSFSFFLIFMIPCAVARNIQTMLVARFLDGLAGSAFLSVAGGTVGDMFAKHVSCCMLHWHNWSMMLTVYEGAFGADDGVYRQPFRGARDRSSRWRLYSSEYDLEVVSGASNLSDPAGSVSRGSRPDPSSSRGKMAVHPHSSLLLDRGSPLRLRLRL